MSEYRDLRWFETTPDAYTDFGQRQRQWSFSYRHPRLWCVYRLAARTRCALLGHDYSTIIEHEKFDLSRLGHAHPTHCLFCGRDKA